MITRIHEGIPVQMLCLSLSILVLASVAAWFSYTTVEEIVKVAMACLSVLSVVVFLMIAPWPVKIVLLSLSLVWISTESRKHREIA